MEEVEWLQDLYTRELDRTQADAAERGCLAAYRSQREERLAISRLFGLS